MKWLSKFVHKLAQQGSYYNESSIQGGKALSSVVEETSLDRQNGMHFVVFKANGGHVIEFRKYDRKTDRNNNSLHIVTPEQDLGQQIAQIITFESLHT